MSQSSYNLQTFIKLSPQALSKLKTITLKQVTKPILHLIKQNIPNLTKLRIEDVTYEQYELFFALLQIPQVEKLEAKYIYFKKQRDPQLNLSDILPQPIRIKQFLLNSYTINKQDIVLVISWMKELEKLTLHHSEYVTVRLVEELAALPCFVSLNLQNMVLKNNMTEEIISKLQNIKELSLKICKMVAIYQQPKEIKPTAIEFFDIRSTPIYEGMLIYMLRHMPHLKRFYTEGAQQINVKGFDQILKMCPRLEHWFSTARDVTDQHIQVLSENKNQFNWLEIGNSSITLKGLKLLCESQPYILHLNLSQVLLPSKAIILLSQHLPALQSLYIIGCLVRNKGIIYLGKFRHLNNVELGGNQTTAACFIRAAVNLNKVEFSDAAKKTFKKYGRVLD